MGANTIAEAQIEARAKANGTSVDEEAVAIVEERQPTKDFVLPEQIGDLAYFMSDSAASVTGVAMPIDLCLDCAIGTAH